MTFSLNRAELIGRLGHDPEMRYTQDGQALTKFSVATDRPVRPGSSSEADWHQVVSFGKVAEFAGNYLAKGRLVYVAGRIAYRVWESDDGVRRGSVEIVAHELIALDRKPESLPEPEGVPAEGDSPPEPARGARVAEPAPVPAPAVPNTGLRPAAPPRPSANPSLRRTGS